jgi:predicted DNA-binding protein (MmcQ/YjbR family)
VQWGYDLCFKIDGKLFAVAPLEPAPTRLSFKCSAENFAELCERPGIVPAPYMARAQWVGLQQLDAVSDHELRDLLAEAYRLVFERLPRKRQRELQSTASKAKNAKSNRKPGSVKTSAKPAAKRASSIKKKSAKAGRR